MFGKRKIGIALSGGGARGLAHIGVLQVLEDLGVEISGVSGCSMGAAVGAIYCAGINLKEMESYVNSLDWRSFLLFSDFSLSRPGIINGRRVEEVLKKFLGDKTFADCAKDFCCVAVDIISGKKVLLNSGGLVDAVRASLSIPGFFAPVFKGEAMLVDGGIIEPLPTDVLKSLKVNFIIASSIIFESETEIYKGNVNENSNSGKKISASDVLDKSMNIIHAELVKNYLHDARILIEPKVGDFGFLDFTKGKDIIERGRKAAIAKIPEIKRKLRLR
jgi:NTE family protein